MRLALFLVLAFSLISHAAERPNVVFILLDNVGREWFGSYGSEENCTPNMDRIAKEGVRFANCYTTTVCGPSRVELLTGRYPHRTGWYLHHDAALYSGGGFDPKREVTIARVLRDAGYATGIAGKWQVNNLYDEPDALTQHGFQEQLVWPGSIDRDKVDAAFNKQFQDAIARRDAAFLTEATRKIESRYWDPVLIRSGRRERDEGKFGPDLMQQFAFEFLGRHRSEPFFLYYPMLLTHGQNAAEPVVLTPDNHNAPPADEHAKFADMLRYADKLVGQFFAELDKLGLRDNTIVFVASDNGTEKALSARANGRVMQGGLYQINEAGGNVPLMVNCPAKIKGGRTGALADFTDILPTICDLTGASRPKDVTLDGQSFAAFLKSEGKAPRSWIFNEYGSERVVRDERYKLKNRDELFDIDKDPFEMMPIVKFDEASTAAKAKLKAVRDAMPAQTPLPFEHRSLSAFKLHAGSGAGQQVWLEFVLEFGGRGEEPGKFQSPIGIAINDKDELFVPEFHGGRVQKFDSDGKPLASFPVLKHASGIAVSREGLIFVSSITQHRIDVHDASGKLVRRIGQEGAGDGEFNEPGGLLIAPDNTLLVADQCNNRVQRFSLDGKFLGKFGTHGNEPGQFGGADEKGSRFGGPHFIALDRDGALWTTEAKNGRIQKLSMEGRPVLHWGANTTAPGGFGGREKADRNALAGPIAVVVDAHGHVWVSSSNDRVQCFDETGKLLGGLTEAGDKPGQLRLPHQMVFDSKGFLYVVDSSNQRVQKFRVRG
ncbi:MAG: sulfatase-like hydrolase/transferase [Verrucomicrobiaceae bacterium]|nr:sulfatase-like hydrolase/transferase [Verrucomicrobiaceae bacterium]